MIAPKRRLTNHALHGREEWFKRIFRDQIAEAGLEEQFEHFGEVDRTLAFEEVTDAASGTAQLFVRDERVLPSKDDPLRQDITASERLVTELPDEYYAYWNWLPDYVTRFARNN